jgi:palmitoyltransferase ZDHHC1/11
MVRVEPENSSRRGKPYKTINGCTQSLPCWEVIAIGLMLTIEGLSFYLITIMLELQMIVLYLLFGLLYAFLAAVVVIFFLLALSDPSDPHLKDPSLPQADHKLVTCHRCQATVSEKSHHCNSCQRCVDNFDHHCVFLNNCIGGQNYALFGQFLLSLILHLGLAMAIGIIIVAKIHNEDRWVALAFLVLSFAVFAEVAALSMFHCYISFCLYKTTLEWLRGDSTRKEPTEAKKIEPDAVTQSPSHPLDDAICPVSPSRDQDDAHESTDLGLKLVPI